MGAQDDPFPFLLGADVFVLPSHADPAPLVLSEAREAGCAIVASKVDGIPQLLEEGRAGILVPARDPAALSAAICSLVANPQALREWKEKSQYNVGYLSIARVARETLEIYAAASRQVRGKRSVQA
jgi:glycosyltransferase involved in cell wall biosynthesis